MLVPYVVSLVSSFLCSSAETNGQNGYFREITRHVDSAADIDDNDGVGICDQIDYSAVLKKNDRTECLR